MALLAITAAIEIGSLIYRLLDRPNIPRPPLESLQISNAQNGAPIPFGYGTCRVAGQVIWSPGIVPVPFSTSKKGGPSSVNYFFYANFAVAFGEGPATITRMWGDSSLIYDPNPAATSSLDASKYPAWDSSIQYNPGALVSYAGDVWECVLLNTGEVPNTPNSNFWLQAGDYPNWNSTTPYNVGDVVTYQGQLWVSMVPSLNVNPPSSIWSPSNSNNHWQPMASYYPTPTIYPGNQTQNPDSLIQASEGAANVPGYRGLCYAVFERFPLQNFGNRIPNLRAEVIFQKVVNVL